MSIRFASSKDLDRDKLTPLGDKDWLIPWVLLILCLPVLFWAGGQIAYQEHKTADEEEALRRYAKKTRGHLERYKTGSHVERRYAGQVGDGKGGTTSLYNSVVVEDYSNRIVYFDDRPPYYPEDNDEWREEYKAIREEHGDK